MVCDERGYAMVALAVGLLGAGGLSLAIVADYWLFTVEPRMVEWPISENTTEVMDFMVQVFLHSGLWRACLYITGKAILVEQCICDKLNSLYSLLSIISIIRSPYIGRKICRYF